MPVDEHSVLLFLDIEHSRQTNYEFVLPTCSLGHICSHLHRDTCVDIEYILVNLSCTSYHTRCLLLEIEKKKKKKRFTNHIILTTGNHRYISRKHGSLDWPRGGENTIPGYWRSRHGNAALLKRKEF